MIWDGDEGEHSAIEENDMLQRGVLENYAYDVDAGTYEGAAEFAWIDEDGLITPDLVEGTFEVRC